MFALVGKPEPWKKVLKRESTPSLSWPSRIRRAGQYKKKSTLAAQHPTAAMRFRCRWSLHPNWALSLLLQGQKMRQLASPTAQLRIAANAIRNWSLKQGYKEVCNGNSRADK